MHGYIYCIKGWFILGAVPAIKHPPITSSAIFNFRLYLKAIYQNSPISPDTKWPPTPSKTYISLAVVEGQGCRDEYIGYTLRGSIKDVLKNRKEICIDQLLEPDGQTRLRLVLMEGAPGIGKSTLAWELCKKWERFSCLKDYSLVILLRLREEEVQQISNISQIFHHYYSEDKDALVKEIAKSQGRDILFILDGFDELPKPLQSKGFFLSLIMGTVLPQSTVLVTSRPSATCHLLVSCRPQIQRHVEVIGFTQESIEAYASSVFSPESEMFKKFKAYISASYNPAINSLMYVPLNAAIIVEIYRDTKSDDFLPHTLTELYTQLCVTILNRYLKIHCPLIHAEGFEDLPCTLYQQFLHLSRVAFEGFMNEELILHAVPPNLIHFGFLDAVSALYGGGGVSYNFLHSTIQEFFAAYHISYLGRGALEMFHRYCKNQRWSIVWRFVAGLTKFGYYEGYVDRSIFVEENGFCFKPFLFQCLFEARTILYFSPVTVSSISPITGVVRAINPTSLDAFALGFCIANFKIYGVFNWAVTISGVGHHSFTCGLKTKIPSVGAIEVLHVYNCPVNFDDLRMNPLRDTSELVLAACQLTNTDMIHLSELIPKLTRLKQLSIDHNHVTDGQQEGLLQVLHKLRYSNVTTLDIGNTGLGELLNVPLHCFSALKSLMDPFSGRLEFLGLGTYERYTNDEKIAELLSAPSSLKSLRLSTSNLSAHSVYLKSNTSLVQLALFHSNLSSQVRELVEIVSSNQTLRHLALLFFQIQERDFIPMEPLISAIYGNRSLQQIEIYIRGIGDSNEAVFDYMKTYHGEMTLDSRITWKVSVAD